jgi:hypothetical protein
MLQQCVTILLLLLRLLLLREDFKGFVEVLWGFWRICNGSE